LTRETDIEEFSSLAETLGIEVVETILQRGVPHPRTHLGTGRIAAVADELSTRVEGHPWTDVDLVLVHANLLPRQLVEVTDAVGVETWDRVRLLIELFTQHASSVEARTQVRMARLSADRSLLRELVNRETSGERLGWGAGGRTGWRAVLDAVGREITSLRRRRGRTTAAMRERQRQRRASGARTVGFAGYTNAGKSSLFAALSSKPVLIEDRAFSTLETTVGRMERSPRVLLVDTIGFIDDIPADLLDAFRATLDESIGCDLLLLALDASDPIEEASRRLATCRRELLELAEEDNHPITQVVLCKSDECDDDHLRSIFDLVESLGCDDPIACSSKSGDGIEELRQRILSRLHGPPRSLLLSTAATSDEMPLPALEAAVRREAMVLSRKVDEEGIHLHGWIDEAAWQRLLEAHPERISDADSSRPTA